MLELPISAESLLQHQLRVNVAISPLDNELNPDATDLSPPSALPPTYEATLVPLTAPPAL